MLKKHFERFIKRKKFLEFTWLFFVFFPRNFLRGFWKNELLKIFLKAFLYNNSFKILASRLRNIAGEEYLEGFFQIPVISGNITVKIPREISIFLTFQIHRTLARIQEFCKKIVGGIGLLVKLRRIVEQICEGIPGGMVDHRW